MTNLSMPARVGIQSWVLMPFSPWQAVQLRAMNAPRWGSPAEASRIVLSVQAISDGLCAGGCAAPLRSASAASACGHPTSTCSLLCAAVGGGASESLPSRIAGGRERLAALDEVRRPRGRRHGRSVHGGVVLRHRVD